MAHGSGLGNFATEMSHDGGSPRRNNRGKQQLVSASDIADADVLCGRGRAVHIHIGNIRFRDLVLERAAAYHKHPDDKPFRRRTALDIIRIVQSKGGRFLKMVDDPRDTTAEGGLRYPVARSGDWKIADLSTSITKVKQALRDVRLNNNSKEGLDASNPPEESKIVSEIAQVPELSLLRNQASLSPSILDELHRIRSEEQQRTRSNAQGPSTARSFDEWNSDMSRRRNTTAVRLDSSIRSVGNPLHPSDTSYGPSSLLSDNQWNSINRSPRITETTTEQELSRLLSPAGTTVAPSLSHPLNQYLETIRTRLAFEEQQQVRHRAMLLSGQYGSFASAVWPDRSDLFGQQTPQLSLDTIWRRRALEQHHWQQQLALYRPRLATASAIPPSMNYASLLSQAQPNYTTSPRPLLQLLHHCSGLSLVPEAATNSIPDATAFSDEARLRLPRRATQSDGPSDAATRRAEPGHDRSTSKSSSPSRDDGKPRGRPK